MHIFITGNHRLSFSRCASEVGASKENRPFSSLSGDLESIERVLPINLSLFFSSKDPFSPGAWEGRKEPKQKHVLLMSHKSYAFMDTDRLFWYVRHVSLHNCCSQDGY
ncbi:hypothetical protein TNCT_726231 [Trichonephila clavata]|uniref:Uncharacterized protein n=1 Tax=Trichonephila clavata TaxID=2740835 RepID=A0A8X6FI96_TRICU|nr:hypothetical protein TNCT_726231 [Trichonephila clavata]